MSTLLWFRQDLRLADNPALCAAFELGEPVVPVFIYAPEEEGAWPPGGASRWWLHRGLAMLDTDLRRLGLRLILRRASDSCAELASLARQCAARHILWNRRYEPAGIERDRRIKSALTAAGLNARSFNGALLHEPWEVKTQNRPTLPGVQCFWRHCLTLPEPKPPLAHPPSMPAPKHWPASLPVSALDLEARPDWARGIDAAWKPGSDGAQAALDKFLVESRRGL